MPRCANTETCSFFTAEVGFSPILHDRMKECYCLGDHESCARLHAGRVLGNVNLVPQDLLPSDMERAQTLGP
jgi:hypothetical protein